MTRGFIVAPSRLRALLATILAMVLFRLLRVRVLLVALVAILLALCGRGLGLWSSGAATPPDRPVPDSPVPDSPVPADRELAASPGAQLAPIPTPTPRTPDEPPPTSAAAVVPAPEVTVLAVAPAPAAESAIETAAAAGVESDRLGARLALARAAAVDGRLGAAMELLDGVELAVAEELRGSLSKQLERGLTEFDRHVRSGAFHAAVALLEHWAPRHETCVAAALLQCTKARGWPSLHDVSSDTVPPPVTSIEPPPAPQLQGRLVRCPSRDAAPLARVRVLAQNGQRATLRVVSPQGVTFPSLPAWQLEPEAPTALDATELGLAAYADGGQLAARVWCAIALARSEQPSPRLRSLQALLP